MKTQVSLFLSLLFIFGQWSFAQQFQCEQVRSLRWSELNLLTSVQSAREIEIEMNQLSKEAKRTNQLSSGLFVVSSIALNVSWVSAAITLGPENIFLFQILGKVLPETAQVALASGATVALSLPVVNLAIFAGAMVGPATIGIMNGYYTFYDESTQAWIKLTEVELFKYRQELAVEYKKIHELIQKKRNDVDLSYSKMQDGLSFGRRSAEATQKLAALYSLDRQFYEMQYNSVKKINAAIISAHHCQ